MPTAAQVKVAAASNRSARVKLTSGDLVRPASAPGRPSSSLSNTPAAEPSQPWLGGGWRRPATAREHRRGPPGFLLCRDGRIHTPGPGSYSIEKPSAASGFSMGALPFFSI